MKRMLTVGVVLLLIAAGSAFAYFQLQPQPQPAEVLYGSGRIEVDEVRIAPQVAGRLLQNRAREGEVAREGQVLARLDGTDFELEADRAQAHRQALSYSSSQFDGQIRLAEHHADLARSDLGRYESLKEKGWVTIPQLDIRRNAYQAAVEQAASLRQQRNQAVAETAAADRSIALAHQQLGRTVVRAPLTAVVLERLAEPGEIIAPGQPIAILGNLRDARLKVFVSEADLGRLRLGAPARIRVDAFPDRTFEARVARIDAQAQFTPRDVHMQDERVRTVYGVTLEAANRRGLLKPGMPADAWILWDTARGWPARLAVPE